MVKAPMTDEDLPLADPRWWRGIHPEALFLAHWLVTTDEPLDGLDPIRRVSHFRFTRARAERLRKRLQRDWDRGRRYQAEAGVSLPEKRYVVVDGRADPRRPSYEWRWARHRPEPQ